MLFLLPAAAAAAAAAFLVTAAAASTAIAYTAMIGAHDSSSSTRGHNSDHFSAPCRPLGWQLHQHQTTAPIHNRKKQWNRWHPVTCCHCESPAAAAEVPEGATTSSRRKGNESAVASGSRTGTTTSDSNEEDEVDDDDPFQRFLTTASSTGGGGGAATYARMDLSARASSDTHAIYGALLLRGFVEEYRVYKKVPATTTPPHSTAIPPPPVRDGGGDDVTTEERIGEVDEEADDNNSNSSSAVVVTAIVQLGHRLDGHTGIVHGGILALLVDDVLGFGYEALPDNSVSMAVTANLNINYVRPVPAGSTIRIVATLQSREGRKLFWQVKVHSAHDPECVYCMATSLFIIPKEHYSSNTRMRRYRLLLWCEHKTDYVYGNQYATLFFCVVLERDLIHRGFIQQPMAAQPRVQKGGERMVNSEYTEWLESTQGLALNFFRDNFLSVRAFVELGLHRLAKNLDVLVGVLVLGDGPGSNDGAVQILLWVSYTLALHFKQELFSPSRIVSLDVPVDDLAI
jgi:uncharacterized protein (TIGR00369 family)